VKPKDLDVVRLLRPLPDHDLPAGSEGTVVNDYQRQDVPPAYLVEFADSDGVTQALVTIDEADLEVVWRPDSGTDRS
jgi:hypothetical protein